MQTVITRLLFSISFLFILVSCGDDGEDNPLGLPLNDSGFFIVNEGAFGNSNTSLSFYSDETGEVTNNIFQLVNERPLGDQSQSMAIHEDEGFIVVQNSGKVEVIDVDNFESIATITDGLESPRYFIGLDDDKGYVSDWGADGFTGSVKVIDLENYSVSATIVTGAGSNQMVMRGGFLYVANNGGFGTNNTISVIDTSSDEVVETVEVGDNPSNLVLDSDDNIWVLGSGSLAFDPTDFSIIEEESTPGFISRINSSNQVDLSLSFDTITGSTADDLVIDLSNNRLYFNFDGGVWQANATGSTISTEMFLDAGLYGLSVDPSSGQLIGTQAPDFASGGNLIFYDSEGNQSTTQIVGIGPNSCVFKD